MECNKYESRVPASTSARTLVLSTALLIPGFACGLGLGSCSSVEDDTQRGFAEKGTWNLGSSPGRKLCATTISGPGAVYAESIG